MTVYFVTGTDTDAGKTLATSALLCAAKQQQLSTLGLKPIASGSHITADGLRNSDALALQEQSAPPSITPPLTRGRLRPLLRHIWPPARRGALLTSTA